MSLPVSLSSRALADLKNLFDFIMSESGWDVADRYVGRIEAACRSLTDFPQRGIARNDLSAGLRVLHFERRATIAYHVLESEVVILRILYGGRDYETLLKTTDIN